jgi:hypothetical protein
MVTCDAPAESTLIRPARTGFGPRPSADSAVRSNAHRARLWTDVQIPVESQCYFVAAWHENELELTMAPAHIVVRDQSSVGIRYLHGSGVMTPIKDDAPGYRGGARIGMSRRRYRGGGPAARR